MSPPLTTADQERTSLPDQERTSLPDQERTNLPDQKRTNTPDQDRTNPLDQERTNLPVEISGRTYSRDVSRLRSVPADGLSAGGIAGQPAGTAETRSSCRQQEAPGQTVAHGRGGCHDMQSRGPDSHPCTRQTATQKTADSITTTAKQRLTQNSDRVNSDC